MSGSKQAVVALVVIAAGFVAALPFQRTPSSPSTAPAPLSSLSPPMRWRDPNVVLQIPGSTERSPAEGHFRPLVAEPQRVERPAAVTAERSQASPGTTAAPTEPLPQRGLSEDWPAPASPPESRTGPPLRRVIRHTLVDGDTLEALAARYLGDAGRWSEIFAANRGLLTNPALLPLGVELQIPLPHDMPTASTPAEGAPGQVPLVPFPADRWREP